MPIQPAPKWLIQSATLNPQQDQTEAEKVVKIATDQGLKATVAGHVEKADRREVVVKPWGITLESEGFLLEA